MSVGARKYTEDSTLLELVTKHIMAFAVSSLYSMSDAVPAIQAVLLLCLWPLPVNTTVKDPSHALAGAAMQLAVQNGLHVYGHEQDFYRENVKCKDTNKLFRARLWVHCATVFQRLVVFQVDRVATDLGVMQVLLL